MKTSGDIRTLANTLFLLVKKNWSSEIRLHAFKMLQVEVYMLLLLPFGVFSDVSLCLYVRIYLYAAFGAVEVGRIKPGRAQEFCKALH
jgi:hypothetical protein